MADTFRSGQIALTGAAQQLTALPKNVAGVTFSVPAANTGPVHFGGSDLTATNGFTLRAGESITFDVQNPGKIYVLGVSTERLTWATVGA